MQIDYEGLIWQDGEFLTKQFQHPIQVGYGLADGVFETIAFRQNQLEFLQEHLDRLRTAIDFFQLRCHYSEEELSTALRSFCGELTPNFTYRIKLAIVRVRDGVSVSICAAKYHEPPEPLTLKLCSVIRAAGNPSCRYKTLAYTDNLAAQREVGLDHTALMLNQSGRVACAAFANIYVKVEDVWHTPPISEGVLPGIIRAQILQQGHWQGVEVVEASILPAQLAGAELFVSNSLIACKVGSLF